jgi:hypothetical protein
MSCFNNISVETGLLNYFKWLYIGGKKVGPQPFLQTLSSSNLNAVQLDAYDSPQFKAMLEQLLKPLNLPPEQINYPADWPSQDKIRKLLYLQIFSMNYFN